MSRFTEPSTWAGIAVLFHSVVSLLPPQYQIIAEGASVMCGALAAMIAEKGTA